MLKEILTHKECASCRGCCRFDKNDCWIYPKLTEKESQIINEKYGIKTKKLSEDTYCFDDDFKGEDLLFCPALGKKGCEVGNDRPVSCKYYPLVLVKNGEKNAIALDTFCHAFDGRKDELVEYTKEKLAMILFEHARKNPHDVYPLRDGLELLITE